MRTPHSWNKARKTPPRNPRFNERGEGVISAAIAVLVMAAIGALMWVGFSRTFQSTNTRVDQQVQQIGN